MVVLIVTLIFLGIFGFAAYMVVKTLKKTDPKNVDSSTRDDITTAAEFLPFEDDGIKNNALYLGNHNYRAFIECSSINYNLRTEEEKEIIEASFGRMLNSLTHPITIYIQTRKINNKKMLEETEKQSREAVKRFPRLEDYSKNYLANLSQISDLIGNNKQKKKYIIVPYNEALGLDSLDDKEKENYSLKELENRAYYIIDSLSSMGIKAKLLNTKEIAELIYSAYHKDENSDFENISDGTFMSLIVGSDDNPQRDMNLETRLDWILYEAQSRIQNELLNRGSQAKDEEYLKLINQLNYLRNKRG